MSVAIIHRALRVACTGPWAGFTGVLCLVITGCSSIPVETAGPDVEVVRGGGDAPLADAYDVTPTRPLGSDSLEPMTPEADTSAEEVHQLDTGQGSGDVDAVAAETEASPWSDVEDALGAHGDIEEVGPDADALPDTGVDSESPSDADSDALADAGDAIAVTSDADTVTSGEPDVVTPPVEPPDYEGTCCAVNGSQGCDDPDCAEAICGHDAYCCSVTWDVTCALCAMGKSLDGGCAGLESACLCDVDAAEPCCESHAAPLCDSPYCVAAVCALDTYCCDTSWDTYCVQCAQGEATYAGTSCLNVDDSCGCEPPPVEPEEPEEPTHFELAEAWAPVWYHDTDDTSYASDYITAFDFDGDTVSNNNWENLFTASADLGAVVYWSVVETVTHWYILYTDFHPRDWTENCDPLLPFLEPCHENDMEGAMVMVKKDDSAWGEFVLLVTEAHNILHIFTNDPAITAKESNHLEDVGVSFEGERHPKLYVESKGHGVCALDFDGPDHCQHPVGPGVNPFPGGDGIVYRYKGQAEVPTSGNDQDVGYALVSFYDTIWQQRDSVCDGACTFDGTFSYQGTSLAKAFDGDTWGEDKANPPWAWDDPDDGPVYRGDFFFRPASTVKIWLNIPGWTSTSYSHNLFLDEL